MSILRVLPTGPGGGGGPRYRSAHALEGRLRHTRVAAQYCVVASGRKSGRARTRARRGLLRAGVLWQKRHDAAAQGRVGRMEYGRGGAEAGGGWRCGAGGREGAVVGGGVGRLQTHPRTRSSPPQPGWRRRRRRWLPTRCYRAPVRASRRKPPAHAPHARAGAASGRRRGRPRPNRARGYLHPRGCRCARAAPAEGRGAPSPSRLGSRGCDRRRLGGRGRRPSGERHSERGAGVHGAGAEAGGGPRGTPFMEATAAAAGPASLKVT